MVERFFDLDDLTNYHESGYGVFTPKEWDTTMGSWLTLPTEASYL